jgi:hypothetical protein
MRGGLAAAPSNPMDHMRPTICIGYDSPHPSAFAVCRHSLCRHMTQDFRIIGIELGDMRRRKLYTRPTQMRASDGQLWDEISEAPMATEFAISRFLTPFLGGWGDGWAVFMDCDMLAMTDITQLWHLLDNRYAVMCTKPSYVHHGDIKMDGRQQTIYPRKLWSSLMAFNLEHQANSALTLELINGMPGRDLHRFCWLPDNLIGELPAAWNWMEGISDAQISPSIVHFTHGGPWLQSHQDVAFAEEWKREHALWVAGDASPWEGMAA